MADLAKRGVPETAIELTSTPSAFFSVVTGGGAACDRRDHHLGCSITQDIDGIGAADFGTWA